MFISVLLFRLSAHLFGQPFVVSLVLVMFKFINYMFKCLPPGLVSSILGPLAKVSDSFTVQTFTSDLKMFLGSPFWKRLCLWSTRFTDKASSTCPPCPCIYSQLAHVCVHLNCITQLCTSQTHDILVRFTTAQHDHLCHRHLTHTDAYHKHQTAGSQMYTQTHVFGLNVLSH